MKIVILCGPSGSGKSTWASNLSGAETFSADHHFVGDDGVYRFNPAELPVAHGACLRGFTEAVRTGGAGTVVVDNTNTTLTEIAPYVAVARAYGVEPEVRVWCGEAPAHALTRNSHGVPPEAVKAMWGRMNDTFTNWPRFWPAPIVMRVEG